MKMNRIVYLFTRRFYKVPWLFHEIIKAGNGNKYTIEERYNIVRNVCKKVNYYAHVEIECSGLNNIPEKNGYILTPNHQGLFDVLLICDTHANPTSFVIRNDLAKIPLLKQTIKALDAKALDRDDPRQGMRIIKEMTDEIKEGRNFIIFPEGTRNRNGNIPGNFKGGSFKSAVKAKAPIVPVALIDSYKPFDIKDTKHVQVQIHYLKPLYFEEYKDMKTTEIASIVKDRIAQKIQEKSKK